MERDTPSIVWVIDCGSPETLRQAEEFAKKESDLNYVFVDVVMEFPNGVEKRTTEHHRVGDYFDHVQVVPDSSPSSRSFRLVFQPRRGAKRYWKDMMVHILDSIRNDFADVSIYPAIR